MDRDFAKIIVQNVRDHFEAHLPHTQSVSFWIATSPNPLAVVNALPFELQNDSNAIVGFLQSAVCEITAFQDVGLCGQVRSLRANRG